MFIQATCEESRATVAINPTHFKTIEKFERAVRALLIVPLSTPITYATNNPLLAPFVDESYVKEELFTLQEDQKDFLEKVSALIALYDKVQDLHFNKAVKNLHKVKCKAEDWSEFALKTFREKHGLESSLTSLTPYLNSKVIEDELYFHYEEVNGWIIEL